MILIGQYDSPFVRRVGIALHVYGFAFEHRPWSVFSDAPLIRAVSPLGRVPILVTDGGTALPDSASILDYLDTLAEQPLLPPAGPARVRALARVALAVGLAEKAVALLYERLFHEQPSQEWMARCQAQILSVLGALEADRAAVPGPFWRGEGPGHDDIALACAWAFLAAAHPALAHGLPAIAALAARCENLPAFQAIRQEFIPPA